MSTKSEISAGALFIEKQSPFDFSVTVEKLTKEIENTGWSLPHVYDLQQTMAKHGKSVLPVKVLSLCHPKHSARILERNDERIVSSMMPCRISVYEKADGKTYVSMMNSQIVAKSLGGLIEEVMTDSSVEVEGIIADALKQA